MKSKEVFNIELWYQKMTQIATNERELGQTGMYRVECVHKMSQFVSECLGESVLVFVSQGV